MILVKTANESTFFFFVFIIVWSFGSYTLMPPSFYRRCLLPRVSYLIMFIFMSTISPQSLSVWQKNTLYTSSAIELLNGELIKATNVSRTHHQKSRTKALFLINCRLKMQNKIWKFLNITVLEKNYQLWQ